MYSFSAIDANVTSVFGLDLNIGNDYYLVKENRVFGGCFSHDDTRAHA
jgi:hypothetical protein